jgi:hypothetical protein
MSSPADGLYERVKKAMMELDLISGRKTERAAQPASAVATDEEWKREHEEEQP